MRGRGGGERGKDNEGRGGGERGKDNEGKRRREEVGRRN